MNTVRFANDLVSSSQDIVNGFKWQAEQKLLRSKDYFDLAKYFLNKNKNIPIDILLSDDNIKNFLLSACMLSKKSLGHISIQEQNNLLHTCINFNLLNDPSYERELIYRYFLTSGDALGGVMRNAVGQAAQNVLTDQIIMCIQNRGYPIKINTNINGKIIDVTWTHNKMNKTIFFDKKPQFLGKSVDFIVVQAPIGYFGSIHNIDDIVACGELKGGVDPAGADEHWKTARSALDRIEHAYANQNKPSPKLYFIGAAIESSMSAEIFSQIQNGKLTGAANLMKINQLTEVVNMIVS